MTFAASPSVGGLGVIVADSMPSRGRQSLNMRTDIKVRLVRKLITVAGLSAEDAKAFLELAPSGSLETTEATFDASGLPKKQEKELWAVVEFAKSNVFPAFVRDFMDQDFGAECEVAILSDGDDPPDAILTVGARPLRIEISDFPPNQAPLLKVVAKTRGPSRWPTLHEAGRNPKAIEQFMAVPESLVQPRLASVDREIEALYDAAMKVASRKDEARCSDILLLHGPAAFSYPEEEVVTAVVRDRRFVSFRAVVFVNAQGCRIWPTNLVNEKPPRPGGFA